MWKLRPQFSQKPEEGSSPLGLELQAVVSYLAWNWAIFSPKQLYFKPKFKIWFISGKLYLLDKFIITAYQKAFNFRLVSNVLCLSNFSCINTFWTFYYDHWKYIEVWPKPKPSCLLTISETLFLSLFRKICSNNFKFASLCYCLTYMSLAWLSRETEVYCSRIL